MIAIYFSALERILRNSAKCGGFDAPETFLCVLAVIDFTVAALIYLRKTQ